ncbi:MAG TPA: hypothetical protein VN969_11550 [Streptosporangiaceae bacterium]|nr:hypothetical protein [Streptosporangiaceae bacterium]
MTTRTLSPPLKAPPILSSKSGTTPRLHRHRRRHTDLPHPPHTAAALLAGGMAAAPLTGRPVLRSGLRQLVLGAVAVTFAVGSLIGGRVR